MAVLDRLRAELDAAAQVDLPLKEERPGFGEEDRELAGRLREALARLAAAAWAASGRSPDAWEERAMRAALDGAELVWASEVAAERVERLAQSLPGFVFVALLPALKHDGALRASKRASELSVEAQLPGA